MKPRILNIAALLLSCSCLVGCDGYTSVGGRVLDKSGAPIANASVRLKLGDTVVGEAASSNEKGDFYVAGVHAPSRGKLAIIVEANGFEPKSQTVSPNTKREGLDVVLLKPTEGTPGP